MKKGSWRTSRISGDEFPSPALPPLFEFLLAREMAYLYLKNPIELGAKPIAKRILTLCSMRSALGYLLDKASISN
jgi:hypothetical protein